MLEGRKCLGLCWIWPLVKENSKSRAHGLQKSQGLGTGRKSTLSFVIPASWTLPDISKDPLHSSKSMKLFFRRGNGERKARFSKWGSSFWIDLLPPKTCTRFVREPACCQKTARNGTQETRLPEQEVQGHIPKQLKVQSLHERQEESAAGVPAEIVNGKKYSPNR